MDPTGLPTDQPSMNPSLHPTEEPTSVPTADPTPRDDSNRNPTIISTPGMLHVNHEIIT